MAKIDDNSLKLKAGCLFPEIGRRVGEFAAANPDIPHSIHVIEGAKQSAYREQPA